MASVLGHVGLLSALLTPAEPSGSIPARAAGSASEPKVQASTDRPAVLNVRALTASPAQAAGHAGATSLAGRAGPQTTSPAQDGAAFLSRPTAAERQAPAPVGASARSAPALEVGSAATGALPSTPGTLSTPGPQVAKTPDTATLLATSAATSTPSTLSVASGTTTPLPATATSRAGTSGATASTIAAASPGAAAPHAAGLAATDDDHRPPPVYATRLPPPFRLAYTLRRGAMSGQAELSLQRTSAGYELELKGAVLGLEVLGMSSRGGLGPHGLMPERFVDRRRGKDRLAANFDHGAGRITYSGTPAAQALLPGAQDRLSWMVQLAAVIEADPARYPAGSRIAMSVSGARGDVDTWTFIMQGRQRLSLPSGTGVETLRLTREPRRPYDTLVEVWLDPAQHHLPVRARLTVLPGGDTLELTQQPS